MIEILVGGIGAYDCYSLTQTCEGVSSRLVSLCAEK